MTSARGLLCFVVMLGGCAVTAEDRQKPAPKPDLEVVAPEPPPPPPPPPPSPQALRLIELDGLLNEFERLRRLPPGDLPREQDSARQAFNQLRTDNARVRYAMSLAVPGGAGNEAAAMELLEPLVKNASVPLHGIAFLLSAYIHEQRRLASQLQGLQQNVQGLQQNVQALQQKLDALRTHERSLTERETVPPRRR